MRIAIDYDDTYTLDPMMWNDIIGMFKSWLAKDEFVCVSSRRNTRENRSEIEDAMPDMPIYLTGYNAKQEFMDKLGKHVDVWIDDDPATINPDGKPKASYGKWKDSGK